MSRVKIQTNSKMVDSKPKKGNDLFYLLLNKALLETDIGTFLEQMLLENLIPFKYSDKTFPNSIMWLQAKPLSTVGPQQVGAIENFEEYKD